MKSNVDCTHCDKSFSSTSNLLKHQRNVHKLTSDTSKKICQCDLCGKRFSSIPNLKRHQKHKHGLKHRIKCGSCKKIFRSTDDFDAHIESCQLLEENSAFYQAVKLEAEDNSNEAGLSESETFPEETGPRKDCEVVIASNQSPGKSKHSTTTDINADLGNSLVCKQCLLIFKKKPYLVAHTKICKGTKYADIFKSCPVSDKCYFKYRFKSTLRLHLKKEHDYDMEPPENLQCKKCLLTFTKANSMRVHMKTCQGTSSAKLISCPVSSDCQFKARFKDTLSVHLKNVHKFDISAPQQLKFKSFEEFKAWKKQEEDSTCSQFTSQSGEKRGMNIFYCQRDGSAKPHKSSPRKTSRTLKKGRVKTGAFCPANMRYKIHDDGTVSARYFPSHSHTVEIRDIINHSKRKEKMEREETEESSILGMEYEVNENEISNIDYDEHLEEIVTSSIGYKVHEDEMVAVLYLPSDTEEQKSVIRYATVVARSNNAIDVDKATSLIEICSTDTICPQIESIPDCPATRVDEIDVNSATAIIEIDSTETVNSERVATDDVTTSNRVTEIETGLTVIKFHANELVNSKWSSSPAEKSWKEKIRSTVGDVMLHLDNNALEENLLSHVWQSLNTCKSQLEAAMHSSKDDADNETE